MVGPKTINLPRSSIARQAGLRLIFSLGLFVVLLGYSSYKLYSLALQKSALERAEDMAAFYDTRLRQLDRDWELQARDFKVRLEVTRLLEQRQSSLSNLQAFMTVQGTSRRFQYMLIQSRSGKKVFDFGLALNLERIPIGDQLESGWYLAGSGNLYRVFVVPIWLGEAGTGRMAMFYEIDNSLLFNLATPGIVLTATHDGRPVASSVGQSGLEQARFHSADTVDTEVRKIPWGTGNSEKTQLFIDAPIKVLFTTTELALGAALIPVVDGLILWFTLGFWLMRNTRRIRALGGAIDELAAHHQSTFALGAKLERARDEQSDEVSDVADAIAEMAELSWSRDLERREEEAQRRLWAMVFASSSEAILICDRDNNILTVNDAFTQLTGYAPGDVIGKNPRILSSGREGAEFYAAMWKQLEQQGHWSGEVQDRRKDGSLYLKWLNISMVHDEQGGLTNFVGTFRDITAHKQNEERLTYLANHDTLTGLPNRHLLLDRLESAIGLASRSKQAVGVLFLDLDNFKWVNDSLGHTSGDKLLVAVAQRLKDMVRTSDTVARLGGDEFIVLLAQAGGDADISQVAGKIIAALAQPLDLSGYDFHVTTSMGISIYPGDGDDAATLLKHADAAMYAAKASGKNQYRYFDATMNRSAMERIELEQDLRLALKNNEFELHYQPQLCVARNAICGVEALIRWRHPRLGMVPPDKFIPLAEETSLIIDIGEWVIETACRQVLEWQKQGLGPRRVAVNLSAIQLESEAFIGTVERILEETGVPTAAVEFELTESMVLRNPQRSLATLNRLRELGISLALDDFGTGYSSLSYLKRLPVNTIKIDRTFVEGVPEDEDDSQIVRMIIALAKSVRLEVVAEGIETAEQRNFLKELGCDFLQGYLIARPMPAAALQELLAASGKGVCNLPNRCQSPADWCRA
ncbi:MAG TPA: EAL domain-containing protein [Gallionellaceae bacterium]